MAVAENVGTKIGSSSQNLDNSVVSSDTTIEVEKSKPRNGSINGGDQNLNGVFNHHDRAPNSNYKAQLGQIGNGFEANGVQNQQIVVNNNGYGGVNGENEGEKFKRDIRDLEELLSKLNPMAEEFVPPSLTKNLGYLAAPGAGFGYPNNLVLPNSHGNVNGQNNRRKKNGYNNGKRRVNNKVDMDRKEEMVRRTVYVSDIDQLLTEEQLAALFLNCGQVVDCRVCGDPNSILRFAFVEFTDEEGARAALNLSGTMLGYYPLRVLPSKTAIAPVNPTFLPRSEDEREMCSRTIYCTNIDKKLTQADVKHFFESICGEVQRLRLLGDYQHSTRIAFVEFTVAESAIAALSCSGVILGSLPIRVSPSKTPVRSRFPRTSMH
ncbi:PREDICTED: polyadenylate-binding protein-interacting protein 12-like [Lupinus angustifolius]|uniref:polyadenylate-binding protein-interacting protein 12-like n=1 Tax=Lupinus angustifolius TaxID=3871 RepID=UPI00092F8BE7|nr:PREDICTED: polyadenylate-binding protein-interacting protein 12-like [Lupinus angustifolius]XP_019433505.1 PREDICTED: polyadenylate-binding protein-interacting protein 12-like [Lupinus angustifolius]XP_019433506.1 PREDICTED: polyadenylate-binding protein-interacting protein 12-like [Lupinus angustifolius]